MTLDYGFNAQGSVVHVSLLHVSLEHFDNTVEVHSILSGYLLISMSCQPLINLSP